MKPGSLSEYVGELGALLKAVRVTDANGAPLSLDHGADLAARRLVAVAGARRSVFLVGNGGSAAIAAHMHSDLVKSVRLRAQVFHDVPLLTAITNDDGYERVFADPVGWFAEPGDLLIAISSSGRSPNILAAARRAVERDADCLTFTGFDADNPLSTLGNLNFHVAAQEYGLVEAAHTVLTHFLTDLARSLPESRA